MSSSEENPFSALLKSAKEDCGIKIRLIENVFLVTLNSIPSSHGTALLCLPNMTQDDSKDNRYVKEDLLALIIFERLLLTDKRKYLVPGILEEDALETDIIKYLHRSFLVCESIRVESEENINDCEKMRKLILTNSNTCMRQPALFQDQNLPMQWLSLLKCSDEMDFNTKEFLVQCVEEIMLDKNKIESLGVLKNIFYPLFGELQKDISNKNLITLNKNVFSILHYFIYDKRAPELGEILLDYTIPNPNATGSNYMDTLFGNLLCISIFPKNVNGPFEFFDNIIDQHYNDPSLWQLMCSHQNNIFKIFKQLLLLDPLTKTKMKHWIANCLQSNASRGHLWNNINLTIEQMINQNSSDAFMTSLTAILLRLCIPLCEPTMKILFVDPTFGTVSNEVRQKNSLSIFQTTEDTCLLPQERDTSHITAEKYNFITELFFMTHKAFELSYRVCTERYSRIFRELHNLQSAYQDVINNDPNNEMAKNLLRMLRDQTQQYLCMRNGLTEPENDTLIVKFFEATAIWLTEITLISQNEFQELFELKDFTPKKRNNRLIPISIEYVPPYLKSVPENMLDNTVSYLNFIRNFSNNFIEINFSSHDAFFKIFILFMSSSKLVKNPHLRAKLAEGLECFLPQKKFGNIQNTFVTHVFDDHKDRLQVVNCLLNVFVSIEMTGQSVQFEQKFNYRRPMYAIMEYLWTKPEQIDCFRQLAIIAERNIEDIEPPIFLRFINLLINDAIYLLDESLSNLQQLRQLQERQARGEWDLLPNNERQNQLSNLNHLGMLVRFDNILGRDTINILKLLTTEIKEIFCHDSIVDRIAAMLNYFLLNLVGPQKEKFKVKNKKEFEFDPAQTVMEICHIYVNLGCSKKFCSAVAQDGRSYSSQLFSYAENILIRIGGGQLIGDIVDFSNKVKDLEAKFKAEQQFISDAPEEYLDPIMSTLMKDPVILPSSKVTVDRSTIARHLLSDQTDPFNRAPLTMDKVRPNIALKEEIERWILGKRESKGSRINVNKMHK